jgi:hypothetical protein
MAAFSKKMEVRSKHLCVMITIYSQKHILQQIEHQ